MIHATLLAETVSNKRRLIASCAYSLALCLLALPTIIVYSTPATAADAYRWTDKNGTVVYGTKPPKDARSVTSMKTRKLSTYSSTAVLKRMGRPQENLAPRSDSKDAQSSSSSADWEFVAAELQAERPEIRKDATGGVESCKVWVKNPNTFTVGEVSVAFEFKNGALIPAVGPDEIAAGATAEYVIPDELLPVKLGTDEMNQATSPGKEQADPTVPEVIVHGFKR